MVQSLDVRFTVRQALSGLSLIEELIDFAHFRKDAPNRAWSHATYDRIVLACRRGDLGSLTRDTLLFAVGEAVLGVDVDLANTQFSGAALRLPPFVFGYEPEVLGAIEHFLPRDGTFLDVGSNWGYFLFHLLLDPSFKGQVAAIEAGAQGFGDMERLCHRLNLGDRARLIRAAAGAHSGWAELSSSPSSGNRSIVDTPMGGEVVRMLRIDELGLRPSLIKLDIENYEPEAIEGAAATIAKGRPVLIFEHWSGPRGRSDGREPFSQLAALGYRFDALTFAATSAPSRIVPFVVEGQLTLTPLALGNRGEFPTQVNVLARPR